MKTFKRIIAFALVSVMLVVFFAACADDTPNADITLPNNNNTTDPSNNNFEGYTTVNETVYVINLEGLNVRRTPEVPDDSASNKLGTLSYGKSVTRTGVNEATGWSRIMYNNEVAYVKTEFLSLTEPAATSEVPVGTDVPSESFTACNEDTEVYTTEYVNGKDVHVENAASTVYSAPNKGKAVSELKDGTKVKRVAVFYEKEDDHTYGWSKIEVTVDNTVKTYYIRNSQVKAEIVKDATTTAVTSAT